MRYAVTLVACAVFLGVVSVRPASAQVDLSGIWAPIMHEDQVERAPGPEIGDYLGLPINDAGRMRGESWDASILTMEEHTLQAASLHLRIPRRRQSADHLQLRSDQLLRHEDRHAHPVDGAAREIWTDGRPHPPDFDPHSWQGFSTGHWEGNVLVVETDHLKAGWIRRNGLALSDHAKMTERFFRHGDILTHTYIIEDPVYLTEPLIKTNGFRLLPNGAMQPYPCQPAVEVEREPGDVPHHLPGQNPFIGDFAKKHNLPIEATRGGAETALPEFAKKMVKK
jgi:hypothetical protein